ncbi:cobalt-precorrin-2 C(20)-methyltransferase CbiL [Gottschalkia acidurici 9a]|uniref:Cobalt-precorrin-2 C(20)-methyltransferase CbiL n=1 Tax=Gottschalkia acidurici (strain ATCC 7906 / DSM 604 / BCRC 14475 / CIP 104303 / KCTC 5404 / NCIMB 10678 / 9a) TaxID=1128398 RepID=K0B1Y0_GOTA9|nr:precorrin-2 C(20)-methyltransferase [Gottschalkia acidurici]AFS79469.1 cobalt-precorrin-2 C(20)-methyltransferase CbiL [Gottschalkia acidurici 9a]
MKKLYGVGVGPGDSELITIKGLNAIKESDYIFIPKSKGESTAGIIAKEYTEGKNIIELEFPMGEDNSDRYKNAAKIINDTLKEGQTSSFLTLGDPMTYSTYIYLMLELKEYNINIETIPGITSFGASTSALNLPLTLKGESFYLCDGKIDYEVLKKVDSICILKVNRNKEDIISKLERENFKYVYIKRCTRADETILYDKEEILKDNDYMSLIFGRRN